MSATIRIQTAWAREPGSEDAPWLISAYDEFTESTHNGTPEFHLQALADAKDLTVVEVEVHVPYEALLLAFATSVIEGEVR